MFRYVNWRRGSESNRRIKVLQTLALPLGYRAVFVGLIAKYRAGVRKVNFGKGEFQGTIELGPGRDGRLSGYDPP